MSNVLKYFMLGDNWPYDFENYNYNITEIKDEFESAAGVSREIYKRVLADYNHSINALVFDSATMYVDLCSSNKPKPYKGMYFIYVLWNLYKNPIGNGIDTETEEFKKFVDDFENWLFNNIRPLNSSEYLDKEYSVSIRKMREVRSRLDGKVDLYTIVDDIRNRKLQETKSMTTDNTPEEAPKTQVESTGGKSDYYKIHLPEKVAKRVAEQGYIEIEDLMKYGFGNDFDYGTALKSLKRMFEDQYGVGKAGSDVQYNKNKINYSLDKIMQDLEETK